LELWRGLFQSFRPCPEKAFVNVDITTGIMYKTGPLFGLCLEVIADLHSIPGELDPRLLAPAQGLMDATRLDLSRFFKGARVTIEGGDGRLRVIRGFSSHGANETLFDKDGKQMSVAEYFNGKLGKVLQYPSIVCVEVSGKFLLVILKLRVHVQLSQIGQNALIPLELCTVLPGQIVRKAIPPRKMDELLKFSKKSPQDRFDEIRRGVQVTIKYSPDLPSSNTNTIPLQHLQHGQSEYIRSFGISVNSAAPSGTLMQVEGCVIPPPAITYANNDIVVSSLNFTTAR
jgi:eukaryotic translation initiation factor 2C